MTSRRRQAWIAGAIIALAGPPIGAVFVYLIVGPQSGMTFDALLRKIGTLPNVMLSLVAFAYILAGVPALITGILAGLRIYRTGWVSWMDMLVLVLTMCLSGAVLMVTVGGGSWLELLPALAIDLVIPTILTALILRGLIVGFGIMKRPG